MKYGFKFYYKDGTNEILDYLKCDKIEELCYDFDGFLDWDELHALWDRKPSTKEILEIAFDSYKQLPLVKDYYRIEVDYIENGYFQYNHLNLPQRNTLL